MEDSTGNWDSDRFSEVNSRDNGRDPRANILGEKFDIEGSMLSQARNHLQANKSIDFRFQIQA
ncbi:MAG TPA: hypothetical protein VJX71_04635 [Methylomirabilota bacterium]|nr:hypothetical protein [Methylomirabilota bacterium]